MQQSKKLKSIKLTVCLAALLACPAAFAQACHQTSVAAPSPLMGNHGEIFRTTEGSVFEVVGSYEYLYAYYPQVTICPSHGKMLAEGKNISIRSVQSVPLKDGSISGKRPDPKQVRSESSMAPIEVVLRVRGCDYFIANGPTGYYLLQWYGGYDPVQGAGILGDIDGFGFKDVIYASGQSGKVYVDNYLLSKDRVIEKMQDKCK